MARLLALLAVPEDGRPTIRLTQLSWLGPIPESVRNSMRRVQADEGFWDDVGVMTRHELKKWHEGSRARAFEPPYDSPHLRSHIEQSLQRLDQLLASPDCPSLFLVLEEEFESGMS
jgi:hypothetical protein